jgi:hypothetical protein
LVKSIGKFDSIFDIDSSKVFYHMFVNCFIFSDFWKFGCCLDL